MLVDNQFESEIEVTLIGELLLKPSIYIDIACALMPNDFSVPECREVYNACIMLNSENTPIDALTILHEINKEEQHYKAFLYDASQLVVSTANYKEHIRIVVENAKRRKATGICRELLENLTYSDDIEICRETASELLKSFDGLQRDNAISAKEGYRLILDSLPNVKEYIKTGMSDLDYFVKLRKGDFFGIGGRPSTGKTALALQTMLNISQVYNTVFFSLETGRENIFERIVANHSGEQYDEIQRGGMKQEGIDRIKDSCGTYLESSKFSVVEAAGYTVEQVQSVALQKKADVILIDYLQLLHSNRGKSLYEQVTAVSNDLHTMAQRYNILVIALIQLKRTDGNGIPTMSDLRDSGAMEQDLDGLLLLHKADEEDATAVTIRIAKNKKGLVGKLDVKFKGDIQRFIAIDNHEKPW